MVLGYHIIMTGYGHWLPNDPRGSMSEQAHGERIASLGEVHHGRKTVQPSREELREFHRRAGKVLYFPVLWWNSAERQALAAAFGAVVREEGLTCHACAVVSNHAHLLVRKHRLKAEDISAMLKTSGREALHAQRLVPSEHPVFSEDCCHIYKSDVPAMWNCVDYIQGNFKKHGLDPATYDFVTPYDGWPFHRRRQS